MVNTHSW